MKNIVFLLILMSLNAGIVNAQNSPKLWYTGGGTLNWCNSQPNGDPTLIYGGFGGESLAMLSDFNCSILCYTDGIVVWDANYNIMINCNMTSPGGSLNGDPSSTQSALIIPKPGSTSIFYLFTTDANAYLDGLCYSRLDMSMNGGLGDIDATEKNIQLITPCAEKLNAVRHSNGIDIWVVAHAWSSADFVAYLVTSAGVDTIPVVTTIGVDLSIGSGVIYGNARGALKFSQAGDKVAVAIEGLDMYELYDFNRTTGLLSNYVPLTGSSFDDCYGIEFSNNGHYLYGSERWGNQIWQWDITLSTPAAIQASKTVIATLSPANGGAMLLGPDNKIYITRSGTHYIGRINYPTFQGTACGYDDHALYCGPNSNVNEAMPNFAILSPFTLSDINVSLSASGTNTCGGDSLVSLTAMASSGVPPYSYNWSTGETGMTIQNLSGGIYMVTVTDNSNGWGFQVDTIAGPLPVIPLATINHVDSLSGTMGSISLSVSGGTSPYSFLWSNGASTPSITNLSSGLYTCTITDSQSCTEVFNYTIGYFSPSTPLLVSSIITNNLCYGNNNGSIGLTISGGIQPYTIHWANGNTTSSLSNLTFGNYWVTIYDANVSLPSTSMPWNHSTTAYSHSIAIPANSTFLDGVAVSSGDYIGVFHNDNGIFKCAGYAEYLGAAFTITAYGDDTLTGLKEGFSNGEIFNFKIWDHISSEQSILMAAYTGTFPNNETYLTNGSSGIMELSGLSGVDFGAQLITSYAVSTPQAINAYAVFSNYNSYNVSSFSASDGWISLNVFGGTSPYSFSWSNGATVSNPNTLAVGTYQVTITDNNACTSTFSYTLTAPPYQLSVSATISNETCLGNCDGALSLWVTGGNTPYSYTWSNGATAAYLTNLCPGTYNLTVSDLQGPGIPAFPWLWINTGQNHLTFVPTSVLNQINIQIGDSLALLYLDSGIYKIGGYLSLWEASGLSMTAWGDDPTSSIKDGFDVGEPFTWLVWHSSTGIFEILEASYSVTQPTQGTYFPNGISEVTNFSFLNQSAYFSYEVLPGSDLQLNEVVSSIDLIAGALGSITTAVSGGITPYNYDWSNGANTPSIYYLSAGQYSLMVTDFNGCFLSDTFVIDTLALATPPWQINLSGDSHSILIGGSSNLEINGIPIDMYDYIGVFYDDNGVLECGGYVMWQAGTTFIYAYADNSGTTDKDGFLAGDEFIWKFWDASASAEHPAVATYQSTYPNQQYFALSGSSAVDSIQTIGISGQISSTTKSLLPAGMMLLYQQTVDGYMPLYKTPIINGDYMIEGIEAGNYFLYAIPKPGQEFGIPAYFGNKIDWQNGTWVTVVNHSSDANIYLDPITPYNTGTAVIEGKILQSSDATYDPNIFGDDWFPQTKAYGDPARNIPILLFDNQMNPMDFRLTNEQGNFEFSQLEYGSYFVNVEKAGLQSDSVLVVLDATNPIVSDLVFHLNQGQILSSKNIISDFDMRIFPNPVSDELQIILPGNTGGFSLELFSITGQKQDLQGYKNLSGSFEIK
ncbi:MAG: SprB repeat-containing protein [Bacteroidales bacterium]|nr:SprB repeat-containing protein [Bacteroidales bacterium]MCF8457975.1 SprB repeat-containing protein [Bacteroidales bacterium]